MTRKIGIVLVGLMALLQLAYACFAFLDPGGFATLRGTQLVDFGDADWVRVYASRTLFVALIVGYLLYERNRWMKENQEEKERVALARERRVQRRLSRS